MKLSQLQPRWFATAALFLSLWSCSEKLDSSAVCNILCPPIGGDVVTETFDAVVLDTTVQALSGIGTEPSLLLATRGDTLETRVIIRFDSLPATFVPAGDTAQPITSVDSAFVQLRLDTLSIKGSGLVTIEAYDVDTAANDTSSEAVLALFRPDRFISSQTYSRTELTDTLKYFIDNATVLSHVQNRTPLRIGLRATGLPNSTQMRFLSSDALASPMLLFRATPDTMTKPLTVFPFSRTPVGDPILSHFLVDYMVVAKAPPPAPPTVLTVGGLPARRVYLRFDIPSRIIDSATVVRATLLLNQLPNAALDPGDTLLVLPQISLAGEAVADPTKAAQIISAIPRLELDTLKLKPGDAGITNVELAPAFSLWRTQPADTLPRAIVLRSFGEAGSPLEIRFSSSEDVAALRPRLRISYTSRVPLGIP